MEKRLNKIKLSGKEYPYKCDNFVLAEIQEAYGTISAFELKLSGRIPALDENGNQRRNDEGQLLYKKTEPSLKAVNFMLPLVIDEGLRIEAERRGKPAEDMDERSIVYQIDQPFEVADILLEELYKALAIKKESPSRK